MLIEFYGLFLMTVFILLGAFIVIKSDEYDKLVLGLIMMLSGALLYVLCVFLPTTLLLDWTGMTTEQLIPWTYLAYFILLIIIGLAITFKTEYYIEKLFFEIMVLCGVVGIFFLGTIEIFFSFLITVISK